MRPMPGFAAQSNLTSYRATLDCIVASAGQLTVSISPHKIGAACGGGVAMDHKYFHRHAISVATFLAHFRGFCTGTRSRDISVSIDAGFLSRGRDFFAESRHHAS
jgi:hypothetical protein